MNNVTQSYPHSQFSMQAQRPDHTGSRWAVVLLLVALGGCSVSEPGADRATASPNAPPSPMTVEDTAVSPKSLSTPPVSGSDRSGVPADRLDQLLGSVAAQTGLDVSEVHIEKVQAVTWRDGSLGCPEPGHMYSQALIKGYWVILRAGDERYDMRASQQGDFRRCTKPSSPGPIGRDDT